MIFSHKLQDKLKNNIYDNDDVALIKKVKCLTDLKFIVIKLKTRGVNIIAAIEGEKFLKNVKSLCHTIKDVPDTVLKMQHNLFLRKLLDIYNVMPPD